MKKNGINGIKCLILSFLVLSLVACSGGGSGGGGAGGGGTGGGGSSLVPGGDGGGTGGGGSSLVPGGDGGGSSEEMFVYNDESSKAIGLPRINAGGSLKPMDGDAIEDKFDEFIDKLEEETLKNDKNKNYNHAGMATYQKTALASEGFFTVPSNATLNLTDSSLKAKYIYIVNGGVLNIDGTVKLEVTGAYEGFRFNVSEGGVLNLNNNASLYLDSKANTKYPAFKLNAASNVTQGKNTSLSIPSLQLDDVKEVEIENMEIRGHEFTATGTAIFPKDGRDIAIYALKSPIVTISNSKINGDIHYGDRGAELTFNNTEIDGSVFIQGAPHGRTSQFNIDEGSVLKTELVKITSASPNFKLKVGFNNKTKLRKSFIEPKGAKAQIVDVELGRHGGLDLRKMDPDGKLIINGDLKGTKGSVIKLNAEINSGSENVQETVASNNGQEIASSGVANRNYSKLNQIEVGGSTSGKADVEFYSIGDNFGSGGAINGKDFVIMKANKNNNIELKATKRITAGGYEYDLAKDGKIWHLKSDKKK